MGDIYGVWRPSRTSIHYLDKSNIKTRIITTICVLYRIKTGYANHFQNMHERWNSNYCLQKIKQNFTAFKWRGSALHAGTCFFFLAEFACGRPRCPQGKEAGRDIWSLMENVGMYVHSDLPGHCNDTLANWETKNALGANGNKTK